MNYPTRCTHCMMLLRNLKKYANAHFYINCEEWYIDVQDEQEQEIIASMEWHQSITLERYRELETLTENNHTL